MGIVVALSLAVAACGGDDRSAPDGSAGSDAATDASSTDSGMRGDASLDASRSDAATDDGGAGDRDAGAMDGGDVDGSVMEDAGTDAGCIAVSSTEVDCANGLDDDCDGDVDGLDDDCVECTTDTDCADGDACTQDRCTGGVCRNPTEPEVCTDDVDNDCDGNVDGYDASCTPPLCNVDGWCWAHPLPQGAGLLDALALGPTDVWVVGLGGTVLRWNGTAWTQLATGTLEGLYGIWGTAADDVWVVGMGGTVLHWTGASFDVVDVGTTAWLTDVYGAGGRIWITGETGTLIEGDGSTFAEITTGTTETLRGVGGAAADDAWAGGDGGTLLRRDASGWSSATSPTTARIYDIHALSTDDVWLAGGAMFHWNGTDWADAGAPTFSRTWRAIWASGPNDVYAVGERINGSVVDHWDGTDWDTYRFPFPEWPNLGGLWAVTGTVGGDVWTFGVEGFMGVKQPGDSWRQVTEVVPSTIRDLWVDEHGDAWITNGEGLYGHWDGVAWNALPSPNGRRASSARPAGLWAAAPDDVWAAQRETDRTYTLYHWDGSDWTSTRTGLPDMADVWGASTTRVWATGDRTYAWDGTAWTEDTTRSFAELSGTSASDVWGLSTREVQRFDGTAWSTHDHASMVRNEGLWRAASGTWVAGAGGAGRCDSGGYVLRWDGSWTVVREVTSGCGFTAIGGRGPSDYWVGWEWDALSGAERAALSHWNGATWTDQHLPGGRYVTFLVPGGDGSMWAAGEAVWRRAP